MRFFIACKLSFCRWKGYFSTAAEAQEQQHEHWETEHPGVPFVTNAGAR